MVAVQNDVNHCPHTMKMKRYIFYAVVGVILLLFLKPLFWPYHCTPWAAYRARQRIDLVHPGMTESEVFQTLGLSFYRFRAHVSGSGNPHNYPANYLLWPGVILYCRWDLTTNPPVLGGAKFKYNLDDR